MANKKDPKHPEVLGSYNYFSVFVLFEFLLCPTSTYPRALEFFQKGKSVIKSGRGSLAPLRSARFLVHCSKIPIHLVRRNKKILRYCLEFPRWAGHGAAWKRLRKKQEAGPGAVRRRGLRFWFLCCPFVFFDLPLDIVPYSFPVGQYHPANCNIYKCTFNSEFAQLGAL